MGKIKCLKVLEFKKVYPGSLGVGVVGREMHLY